MLSTDYSQLFSSGMRMIANRGRRNRRVSQPAPALGVSYISFEPDTPLSATPANAGWRALAPKALRRMSTVNWKPTPPSVRRARRTTMPANFAADADMMWNEKRHDVVSSIVSEDDESSTLTEKPSPAPSLAQPQPASTAPRRRPTPLLIISTPASAPATPTAGPNTPFDFLSFSTTSTEFPSPRFVSARPRTLSLSLAMHPYAMAGASPLDEASPIASQDWRRFHDNAEWDALA